jgi:MULE transposase domain
MPLILFAGLNHHWHTIIFDCALLAKEGEEEYKWHLKKFVQCMSGVKPGEILTDQCSSIEKGIKLVLSSEIVIRFYSWHILHKLAAK